MTTTNTNTTAINALPLDNWGDWIEDYMEVLDIEPSEAGAFEAYLNLTRDFIVGKEYDPQILEGAFRDRWISCYDSLEEYALELMEATYPEISPRYLNHEALAQDLRANGDIVEENGYLFYNE